MVGDVLGPPVQGPAHAPDHDPGAEVEHDLGHEVDAVVVVGAGAIAVAVQSHVVIPSPNQLHAPNHVHAPSPKWILRSRKSTNNRLPTVHKHNSHHPDLVNAPSLNPDPGHVQGPDLTPRTTDPSPDPNLSPRQNRSPRIGLAQGLLARVRASPNQGAIQRAQREMVISHQMTKKMIELCAAYMFCVY